MSPNDQFDSIFAVLREIQENNDAPKRNLKKFKRQVMPLLAKIIDPPSSSLQQGQILSSRQINSELLDCVASALRAISVDAWNETEPVAPQWLYGGRIYSEVKYTRSPDVTTALAANELALNYAVNPNLRQRLDEDQKTFRRT